MICIIASIAITITITIIGMIVTGIFEKAGLTSDQAAEYYEVRMIICMMMEIHDNGDERMEICDNGDEMMEICHKGDS